MFPQGSTCLVVLWIPPCPLPFRVRVFHPLWTAFPNPFPYSHRITYAVRTPGCTHPGLGSSAFARRYLRNRCFFLFLRLLRCFSSPGSPPYVMDWRMDTGGLLQWVSPFRYLRIDGYLLLPEAFRSLSRLSSALSAKASTLRSCSLILRIYSVICIGFILLPYLLVYKSRLSPEPILGCLVDGSDPPVTDCSVLRPDSSDIFSVCGFQGTDSFFWLTVLSAI